MLAKYIKLEVVQPISCPILHFPGLEIRLFQRRGMTFYYCQSPALFISPMPSLSAVFALSNRFVFHKDCSALCRVLSCAPTAPALPSGNPALSSYISRSDCGLYYCFPLSAPKGIPNLSNFSLPYLFRKGLYPTRYFMP